MPTVFLTNASTSPWTRPGDWSDTAHTVRLIGCGGRGGTATAGTTYRGGPGGGGGAHVRLTRSAGALASTTAFLVSIDNSSITDKTAVATCWGSASFTNCYYAEAGEGGGVGGTDFSGGLGGVATTTSVGTPSGATYTASQNNNGGAGGTLVSPTVSGGGGGGAGGESGVGGAGGGSTTVSFGGGGGGAGNGGGSATTATTANGTAGAGSNGGAGGVTGTPAGGNATGTSGSGGGGGFLSAVAAATTTGGAGGVSAAYTQTSDSATGGPGGGGGGGGSNTLNTPTPTTSGGNGANYGGGGGGAGGARSATSTRVVGAGASGLIVIDYVSAGAVTLIAAGGSYTLTGTAVTFVTPFKLTAAAGSYALTGSAALVTGTSTPDQWLTFQNQSAQDFGTNDVDGTLNGSPTFDTGVSPPAIVLNGTTRYVSGTNHPVNSQTTNVTICCWVNLTGSDTGTFLHVGSPTALSGTGDGYGLGVGTTQTNIAGNNLVGTVDGVANLAFATAIGTGWHHVALTRDATTWRGYIDGVVCGTTFTSNPLGTSAGWAIGRNVNASTRMFAGKIQDVRFYARQLSNDELSALYAAGPQAAPVDVTLTAAAGAYALTGTAATLRAPFTFTAAAGSYALTGTAATFAYKQSAAVGSYALTGTAATLPTGTTTWKLVTSFTPGADRQDFTGEVGFKFSMVADTVVDQIGLRCATGNTGSHTVRLADFILGSVQRFAFIDLTGGTVGTFYYVDIEPLTLLAGVDYFLSTSVTTSGPFWAGTGPTTLSGATPGSVFAAYCDPAGVPTAETANQQFAGVDLGSTGAFKTTAAAGSYALTGTAATFAIKLTADAAGAAAITWDAATATAVTLSGSNLIATNTGTTSTNQGARVADALGKTAGKYYFEVTFTANTGGINRGIGIGTIASTYSNMGNSATTGSVVYLTTGAIWTNGGNASIGISTGGPAATYAVAVDLDNRKIWFRFAPSGNWNNSGTANPATNVGGVTVPAGTMVPFAVFGAAGGLANNVYTANFGASAFTGTVPSGFTAGWATGAGPYALTGIAATFAYTANVTFAAASGSYALTGSSAAFQIGGNVALATDPGAYALTGTAATFAISSVGGTTFFCGSSSYALTGSPATFLGVTPPQPQPVPPSGVGSYAGGGGYGRGRMIRWPSHRRKDEDLPPPPRPRRPPDLPPPARGPAPEDLKPPAPGLLAGMVLPPPTVLRSTPKPAVVDDDDEAIELILKLLS